MASRDEVIRYVYEVSGDKQLGEVAKELLSLGGATEETEKALKSLADQMGAQKAATAAIDGYQDLARAQGELADATERAGLRLKLASEAEAAATVTLAERGAALEAARAAQADYATRSDRLVLVERELKAAVKDAAAAQKAARQDWEESGRVLADATRGYEKAADAQSKLEKGMAGFAREIETAGLSTRDLAGAQEELAARSQATERAVAGIADAARDSAAHASELAKETARSAAEQGEYSEALARTRARMAEAAKETETLAAATGEAEGMFRRLRSVLAPITGLISFAGIVKGLKAVVSAGSETEQALGQLNAVLESTGGAAGYSAEELLKMADDLRRVSNYSREEIISAQTRLLSYVDVVGEEFPEAMQITIDQAARLGESLEQSAERVGMALQDPSKAMAALARQGFTLSTSQKEMIRTLQATGRMAEAQRLLMDELTESYGGAAAAARFNTFKGIWKGIQDQFDDFLSRIADGGAMDAFKARLTDLSNRFAEMVKDGRAAQWAQNIADSVVKATDAFGKGVRAVVEYSGVIRHLIEVYVLFNAIKISTSILEAVNAWEKEARAARNAADAVKQKTHATRLAAAETGVYLRTVGKLNGLLNALPRVVRFTIFAAGIDFALNKTTQLKAALDELRETNRQSAAIDADAAKTYEDLRQRIAALKSEFEQYGTVAIRTQEDLRTEGEAQLESYARQLQAAEQYYRALISQARMARDEVGLEAAKAKLGEVQGALAGVQAQLEATRAVGQSAASGLGAAASAIAARLDDVSGSAKETQDALASIFRGFDFTAGLKQVGDFAQAFDAVSEKGGKAADTLNDGLIQALRTLSGRELETFQNAATFALESVNSAASATSTTLRTVLEVSLDRLGVKAEDTGVAITRTGEDIIATFKAVATNATASAGEVAAAFTAALGAATTKQEAEALGEVLDSAFKRGVLSAEQMAQASRQLESHLRTLAASVSPLRTEFEKLGITSQATLAAVRDNARAAYDAIVEGARRGEAAQEDVIRAFRAWAEAARAAAADSSEAVQMQVEAQIAAQATALSLGKDLQRLGKDGVEAGERTAAVWGHVTTVMGGTRDVVTAVGDAAADMGAKLDQANEALEGLADQVEILRNPFDGVILDFSRFSDAAVNAFKETQRAAYDYLSEVNIRQYLDYIRFGNERILAQIEAQENAARSFGETYEALTDAQLEQLARQHGGYDQLLARMQEAEHAAANATGQFSMLNDADLSRVQAAAARVAQQVQAIADQANSARDALENMADSIQDQIDQLDGNLAAAEQRRHERQMEQLRQQRDAAGAAGEDEYRRAAAAAERLHRMKMEQIKAEADARVDAERAAASAKAEAERERVGPAPEVRDTSDAAPTRVQEHRITITVNGSGVQGMNLNDPGVRSQLSRAILEEIERWARMSGGYTGR